MDNQQSKHFRLFIAADIPDNIKDRISAMSSELQKLNLDAKWVKPENIHITLKFLGNTDEQKIPSIIKIIEQAVENIPPIACNISELGVFPNIKFPKVLWIGMDEKSHALKHIADTLDKKLSKLGFEAEKKSFKVHLTIARMRSGKNKASLEAFLANKGLVQKHEFMIEKIILYKSTLTPQGPVYNPLHENSLSGNI